MSRSQRLTFLAVAGVIAVVAVVVLSGGAEDPTGEEAADQAAATVTSTPTPESEGMAEPQEAEPVQTPEPTPTPDPVVTLRSSGEPKTVEATQGERVRFKIRSDRSEEMHLHGYDVTKALPAGKTVTVTIDDPQITGIFEIELHGSGEQIGSLKVQPD